MRLLIPFILTFMVIFSGNGYAQSVNIDFEEFTLDNGLHVILHQDNSTPIVAVSIMYHVGSKNERPDRTGFAHFFEHLMFEGSKHIERGEYFQLIQNAGGQVNANTSFDRTFYFQVIPSNQLELALWMESERLLHPIIDEVGLETQREVIIEEKNQVLDNQPYGNLLEQVFLRAYDQHPYQWVPIGAEQDIYDASLEDFESFFKEFYVPENAVLSIAGDLDVEETKLLVEKYFGDIPSGDGEIFRPDVEEPKRDYEIRDTVYDNIQLPAAVMAYRIPERGTHDYYTVELISHLLSTGNSSRLRQRLIQEEQVAVEAGAFALGLENPGQMIIFGLSNQGVAPDKVEAIIEEELEKLKNELISERELEKVLNQLESQKVNRLARVQNIAQSLADNHMFLGDASLINHELENYRAVTREDIQRVAREILQVEGRVVLYYLPESQKQ